MGKTALLHAYIRHNERAEHPRQTLLVRLNHPPAQVRKTLQDYKDNRANTVALLDGLDEDTDIQSNRSDERIAELEEDCDGFSKVVVTTRPEYYEKVYPKLSTLLALRLTHGALGGRDQLKRITLLKFTKAQITRILAHYFPYRWKLPHRQKLRSWRQTWKDRQIAWGFVKLVDDPAFHPMVFSKIVDIVFSVKDEQGRVDIAREERDLWHLYHTIVTEWLKREETKTANPRLKGIIKDISRRLALSIHLAQTADSMQFITDDDLKKARGVTDEQLQVALEALGVTGDDKVTVMERSLLKRTDTKWFFAHESIGWYLFVEQFLQLPFEKRAAEFKDRSSLQWEPLMQQLALGCLRRRRQAGYDLSYAYSNLSKQKLAGYDLSKIDFRHADLTDADFRRADCRGVDFRGADLRRANFKGAQLEGALHEGANTEGARHWEIREPRLGPWLARATGGLRLWAGGTARLAGVTAEALGNTIETTAEFGRSVLGVLNPVVWVYAFKERFTNNIGIDLGTANSRVYVRDQGIVLREPSVVAVKSGTNMVLAVGNEAKRMLGRTPANIVAVRPLRDGVITDFEITAAILRYFITKVQYRRKMVRPRVVIAVPSHLTGIETRALREAATHAGAREVYFIERTMAAAIGVGLPVQDAVGNMIIDIGGGITEVALIFLSGIVFSRTVRVAGDELDEAIVNYVKRAYNLMIGERTAEEIKIKIGSAFPPEHKEKESTMEIKGRDLVAGLPKTLTITSEEVREALMEPVKTIVESVRITLERCPPELASDLVDRGLVLAGGGALLRGLDELLKKETGLPVHVAEDPLSAVAEGTGKVLSEIRFLRQIALPERA